MITLEISYEQIEFFVVLVVSGIAYGYYCYNRGLSKGWDNAIYSLEDIGILYVNDKGSVCRYSDKEYKKIQEETEQYE